MPPLSPTLRKAAILISALDDRTADALLDQIGPQDAAKVRSALVAAGDIPADEQEAVLAEFLQTKGGAAADDVALEIDPARPESAPQHAAGPTHAESTAAGPLAFLCEVAPQALARVLRTEQPQAVAVVVSSLSAELAAELLERLPQELATDALERLAWLDEPAAEALADLARTLRQQLGPHLGSAAANRQSRAHQNAIRTALAARRRQVGPSLPVSIERYRLESAVESVQPAGLVEFNELAQFDEESLRRVFAAADPQLALVALTGADERLVARILRSLPSGDAAVLRQRLEHPGPIRLREIEHARQSLSAIAARLARAGEITLPQSIRFAAAA